MEDDIIFSFDIVKAFLKSFLPYFILYFYRLVELLLILSHNAVLSCINYTKCVSLLLLVACYKYTDNNI